MLPQVSREVVVFGQLLFEMLSGAELSDVELSSWHEAELMSSKDTRRAPWPILQRIFLPSVSASKAPTLLDLLAGERRLVMQCGLHESERRQLV